MTDEDILSELRTIRTLLAFDKQDELSEIIEALDEEQKVFLDELEASWTSVSTKAVAEEADVSKRTVQRGVGELVEMNLIQKQGNGRGTKYRTTGLYKAAELVTDN